VGRNVKLRVERGSLCRQGLIVSLSDGVVGIDLTVSTASWQGIIVSLSNGVEGIGLTIFTEGRQGLVASLTDGVLTIC
jgi:hypothetical protein